MESEIARIRQQIELEYQSAMRVFTDFSETARHEFINKRQEGIAACFSELKKYMSADEAFAIVVEVENAVGVGLTADW